MIYHYIIAIPILRTFDRGSILRLQIQIRHSNFMKWKLLFILLFIFVLSSPAVTPKSCMLQSLLNPQVTSCLVVWYLRLMEIEIMDFLILPHSHRPKGTRTNRIQKHSRTSRHSDAAIWKIPFPLGDLCFTLTRPGVQMHAPLRHAISLYTYFGRFRFTVFAQIFCHGSYHVRDWSMPPADGI